MLLDIEQKKIDRWDVMRALSAGGSRGISQRMVAIVLESRGRIYGEEQLKDLIVDLRDRGYCKLERDPDNRYHCTITPLGTDLVEYTVSCPDAIARPPKPTLPYA